ncbi:OmpH family outer membrane protein [Qipengyuania marisflavi]|uniref:OmpH family outer membrane protein n=1 Tax=Qipengyuania marisflavi TaxID=2486356 RepID=A0A5S3PCR7_9SPHN|nr:OmpH family outer membrane protein [Qipengyuania marisflavi]TMM49049.1 OmpH family outer membrane protein [Qipengyuania marisflavi]
MKILAKSLALAGIASAAFVATPAAAQVAGIATSSPEAVIVRSAARIAAYQQIDQQYAAQIQQARTVRQEIQALQVSLDTNKDNQLSEQEVAANPGVVQQVQQKEQQIGQISQPIVLAQTYAVEQLINDYNNARQQVISQKKIQIMLAPDAIQWAPDSVNVTADIVAALDKRVPTVQIVPPAGWQPRRESYQLQQTVQQVLVQVAQQQAAAAAQPQPQTDGR